VYWQKKPSKINYACGNLALYRFLGNFGFSYKKKNVLEIGFYHGADLIEFKKRKSKIYGLDINKFFVNKFKKVIGKNKIQFFDATKDKIPFKIKFDLIFSCEFVNYLNAKEIKLHTKNIFKKLKSGGLTLVAFLEEDLVKTKYLKYAKIAIVEKKLSNNIYYKKKIFTPMQNPVIFHSAKQINKIYNSCGFKLVGKKTVYETYDINEKLMKKIKYFLYKK
jgi:cyclopropane fatty-acyl-phospholipid synthase-like methyltransferase